MKKLLLLPFFYLGQVNAQLCFSPATNFSVGTQPYSVCSADFNGDGKADLAVANQGSNNVSILLGSGTGSFSNAINFSVGTTPYSVCSADFNGDGNTDLATTNLGSNNISVLLGTGTGSFGVATNFNGGAGYSIISSDFNGDGFADLATENVSVLLGTGTGSFGPVTNFTVSATPSSVTTADFNGDGKADLTTANATSLDLSVLLGTGNGSFGLANITGSCHILTSITSSDLNGDSKTDLAIADNAGNLIVILLGTGTGNFSSGCTTFGTNSMPESVLSADFNGDGKADLAAANSGSSSNNVSVLLGTGSGNFATADSFAVGLKPISAISADFNGDGKTDLATANSNSNSISILLNCTPTPSCVASVTDSLLNISPLNWAILPHYSPQVTNAVWHWGDGTSTSGLYPSHTYTTSSWYNICVTVYTSCGDSASTCRNDTLYKMANNSSMVNVNVVLNPNNIYQKPEISNSLSIFPNPTSDRFYIETNTTDKIIVDLYDVNGRHMFNKSVNNKETIEVSNLNEGVYYLSIKTENSITNKKLVIIR